MSGLSLLISFDSSLRSSLSGNRETREGTGTEVTKIVTGGRGVLLSHHAFARLPLGSRFLALRGNGKDCYTG